MSLQRLNRLWDGASQDTSKLWVSGEPPGIGNARQTVLEVVGGHVGVGAGRRTEACALINPHVAYEEHRGAEDRLGSLRIARRLVIELEPDEQGPP